MHKSIPVSLGMIAVSLIAIAGTMIFDSYHMRQQERQAEAFVAQAQMTVSQTQNSLPEMIEKSDKTLAQLRNNLGPYPSEPSKAMCNTKLGFLDSNFKAAEQRAAVYAPGPNVKDPDSLNDVQAILYRKLKEEVIEIEKDRANWRLFCKS